MAEVFDKISMYMGEAVREAETRVSFTFQWWHWLLVSITVVAVLTFLVLERLVQVRSSKSSKAARLEPTSISSHLIVGKII